MKKLSIFVSLFVFLFVFTSAFAQQVNEKNKGQPTTNQQKRQEIIQLNERISFARLLINDKNYEGAAAFLESLYEINPTNPVIMNLMRQCYAQLQQYSKTEELLKRFIKLYPDNFNYQVAYAQIMISQGKNEEAFKEYEKAISLVEDFNAVRLQMILQSMVSNDFTDAALEYINRWRLEWNDPALFAIQMGAIHEKQKQYVNALEEYYPLLKDTTSLGESAERKMRAMFEFSDSQPVIDKFLLEQTDLNSNARALKLLSAFYLKESRFDEAFEMSKVQDSIAGYPGHILISYMQNCLDGKYFTQAARMGDYIFSGYPNAKRVKGAYYIYGDALTELERYPEAISSYDQAFQAFQSSRAKADALFKIGDILLNRVYDYDSALIYFDSIVNYHRVGLSFLKSKISRPYCYLRKGDIERAYNEFDSLYRKRNNQIVKEEALYNLGLIKFFKKDIDSTEALFNKLIVDFPRGYFINDVLKLMTVIDDAKSYPRLLYDYSNALLFEQMNDFDSTIIYLKLLVENENNLLADIALYKLGDLKLDSFDSTLAVEYYDRLIMEYPESYYLPFGLKKKADILLVNGLLEQARELYQRLLKSYPNYPFISEVRDKLRSLEENVDSV